MNFWPHWFQRQTSGRGASRASPTGGDTCELDEALPALLLVLELPLGLVVDEASVDEADLKVLSWLGDRAEAWSGT